MNVANALGVVDARARDGSPLDGVVAALATFRA
jgi:hypothetical protein